MGQVTLKGLFQLNAFYDSIDIHTQDSNSDPNTKLTSKFALPSINLEYKIHLLTQQVLSFNIISHYWTLFFNYDQ